ncbi:MAG TPA: helix-turn-helix domain-containing protein [Candidatus Gracilibacteria bacterium]
MIETQLKFLGLSDDETKIYLILLKYGTSSVAQISRLTKIGRVNCYHHIEKLLSKGVISQSQQSKIKSYTAEHPRIFLNREQERLNVAKDIVPELLAMTANDPRKPKIQFFEGKNGIKNIFEDMTDQEGGEIVSFSNFDKLTEFIPEFLEDHFRKRFEKGIKTRFIAPWTGIAEQFQENFFPENHDPKLSEIFLISPKEFHFDSEISIFGGAIAIMNLNDENPVGILIENPELYRTQKAIFDLAWLGATSFVTG